MPAGKKRNFPSPGTHIKCRTCEVSLICISGRRRFGERFWCDTCRGVFYRDLNMVIRCVVFRNKRGRYQRTRRCPACTDVRPEGHQYPLDHRYELAGYDKNNNALIYDPRKKGHGRIVNGITHRDAQAWKTGSRQLACTESDDALSVDTPNSTRNP
jgi:hypothetical protein